MIILFAEVYRTDEPDCEYTLCAILHATAKFKCAISGKNKLRVIVRNLLVGEEKTTYHYGHVVNVKNARTFRISLENYGKILVSYQVSTFRVSRGTLSLIVLNAHRSTFLYLKSP